MKDSLYSGEIFFLEELFESIIIRFILSNELKYIQLLLHNNRVSVEIFP